MYDTTKPYVEKILQIIKPTWITSYCQVTDGAYPIVEMYQNLLTIDHTDGIGTKGYYHWKAKTFREAAQDAFAMNINDLLMAGAIPIKMQNHIFLPEDNHDAICEIVTELAELAKWHNIAMTGGETSIHMNMQGMDISITMTGVIKPRINQYQLGDVLIGIQSNGLHSNGFTLVHEKIKSERSEFTKPTRIYVESLKPVCGHVNSLNHITGGGYTKLKPNLIDVNAVFHFEKKPQKIFMDLYDTGIDSMTMYKTFNCGYGLVLGVNKLNVNYVLQMTGGDVIGIVEKGDGNVLIRSAFDDQLVRY